MYVYLQYKIILFHGFQVNVVTNTDTHVNFQIFTWLDIRYPRKKKVICEF